MKKLLLLCSFLLTIPDFGHAATKMVIAPHPDDEALMASGIIEEARLAGDGVVVPTA
jgi:LmbE family N-acetylglucosaminyl deacetylase